MNNKRWIEIQFVMLCTNLYDKVNNYPFVVDYLELLSELTLGKVSKQQAIHLLQKVNQINTIRPTKAEYVTLAKENKITISEIMKTLGCSKSTYMDLYHSINKNDIHPPRCTNIEIEQMEAIIKVHKSIAEVKI